MPADFLDALAVAAAHYLPEHEFSRPSTPEEIEANEAEPTHIRRLKMPDHKDFHTGYSYGETFHGHLNDMADLAVADPSRIHPDDRPALHHYFGKNTHIKQMKRASKILREHAAPSAKPPEPQKPNYRVTFSREDEATEFARKAKPAAGQKSMFGDDDEPSAPAPAPAAQAITPAKSGSSEWDEDLHPRGEHGKWALAESHEPKPNHIHADVRDHEGETMGYLAHPHDGTQDGIRAAHAEAKEGLTAAGHDWSSDHTRWGATDHTGEPQHHLSHDGHLSDVADPAQAKLLEQYPSLAEPHAAAPEPEQHWYGMRNRPPAIGAIPKGNYDHKPHDEFRHGQISYGRPLTDEEQYDYELTPIRHDSELPGLAKQVAEDMDGHVGEYLKPENESILSNRLKQEHTRKIIGHVDHDKLIAELRKQHGSIESSPPVAAKEEAPVGKPASDVREGASDGRESVSNGTLFKRSGQQFEEIQKSLGITKPQMGQQGADAVRKALASRVGGPVIAEMLKVHEDSPDAFARHGFATGTEAYRDTLSGKFSKEQLLDASRFAAGHENGDMSRFVRDSIRGATATDGGVSAEDHARAHQAGSLDRLAKAQGAAEAKATKQQADDLMAPSPHSTGDVNHGSPASSEADSEWNHEHSDQEKGYREQERTFSEVMNDPSKSSLRDLTLAYGQGTHLMRHWDRRAERGEITAQQRDDHNDGMRRELDHIGGLQRDYINGRKAAPADDMSRAEKIAEEAYHSKTPLESVARNMGLTKSEWHDERAAASKLHGEMSQYDDEPAQPSKARAKAMANQQAKQAAEPLPADLAEKYPSLVEPEPSHRHIPLYQNPPKREGDLEVDHDPDYHVTRHADRLNDAITDAKESGGIDAPSIQSRHRIAKGLSPDEMTRLGKHLGIEDTSPRGVQEHIQAQLEDAISQHGRNTYDAAPSNPGNRPGDSAGAERRVKAAAAKLVELDDKPFSPYWQDKRSEAKKELAAAKDEVNKSVNAARDSKPEGAKQPWEMTNEESRRDTEGRIVAFLQKKKEPILEGATPFQTLVSMKRPGPEGRALMDAFSVAKKSEKSSSSGKTAGMKVDKLLEQYPSLAESPAVHHGVKQDEAAKQPTLAEMARAAAGYQMHGMRNEPDDKAAWREHTQHMTKSAVDSWLMKKFNVDSATARGASNAAGEMNPFTTDGSGTVGGERVRWTHNSPEPTMDELGDMPWMQRKQDSPAKPFKPEAVPGQQMGMFGEETSGQKQLFNIVKPKRGDKPQAVAPSELEKIGDEIDARQAERKPLPGQKSIEEQYPSLKEPPAGDSAKRVSNDEFADGDWDQAHSGLASEIVQSKMVQGMKGIEGREYGMREHSPGKWQMVSRPGKAESPASPESTATESASVDHREAELLRQQIAKLEGHAEKLDEGAASLKAKEYKPNSGRITKLDQFGEESGTQSIGDVNERRRSRSIDLSSHQSQENRELVAKLKGKLAAAEKRIESDAPYQDDGKTEDELMGEWLKETYPELANKSPKAEPPTSGRQNNSKIIRAEKKINDLRQEKARLAPGLKIPHKASEAQLGMADIDAKIAKAQKSLDQVKKESGFKSAPDITDQYPSLKEPEAAKTPKADEPLTRANHGQKLWDAMNQHWDEGKTLHAHTMTKSTTLAPDARWAMRLGKDGLQIKQGKDWVSASGQVEDGLAHQVGMPRKTQVPYTPEEEAEHERSHDEKERSEQQSQDRWKTFTDEHFGGDEEAANKAHFASDFNRNQEAEFIDHWKQENSAPKTPSSAASMSLEDFAKSQGKPASDRYVQQQHEALQKRSARLGMDGKTREQRKAAPPIPQKSIDMLNEAVSAKDTTKLKEMLDPSNKSWRKQFEESTGQKLPKTIRDTHKAVEAWASTVEQYPSLAEPKAKEPHEMTWQEIKGGHASERAAMPSQVAAAEAEYAQARSGFDAESKKSMARIKAISAKVSRLNPTGDTADIDSDSQKAVEKLKSEWGTISNRLRDQEAPHRSDFVAARMPQSKLPSGQHEHRTLVAKAISDGKITSHPDYPELTAKRAGAKPEPKAESLSIDEDYLHNWDSKYVQDTVKGKYSDEQRADIQKAFRDHHQKGKSAKELASQLKAKWSSGESEPELNGWKPENHVKIAADSIQKLRGQDVHRLLDSAPPEGMEAMAQYILKHRPELVGDIRDAKIDIQDERGTKQFSREEETCEGATCSPRDALIRCLHECLNHDGQAEVEHEDADGSIESMIPEDASQLDRHIAETIRSFAEVSPKLAKSLSAYQGGNS